MTTYASKVMQALELDGRNKSEVSELFNIRRNRINLWFERKAETGDVRVKPRQMSSAKQKIAESEKFRVFAKEHEEKTQAEMAQLWEGDVSSRTISRVRQKVGLTGKKRRMGMANETPRNVQSSGNS